MIPVDFEDLGIISYKKAWDYQEELFSNSLSDKNNNKKASNYLLFCQHNHVYTLGKSGNEKNLLLNKEMLKSKNVEFYKINRGGDITYHGPGQIVGYPIFDLEQFNINVKEYIYKIEEVIIKTLNNYNIFAERLNGATGVWIDTNNPAKVRKICAIGVKASRYITMHGFAFNVNTNLDFFSFINPCGFTDKSVTSMQKELSMKINLNEVRNIILENFIEVFNIKINKNEK